MIPDAAVEAAASALRDAFDWGVGGFDEQARKALEAAAPHLMAQAWDEAYAAGIADERTSASWATDYGPNRNNPYRTT